MAKANGAASRVHRDSSHSLEARPSTDTSLQTVPTVKWWASIEQRDSSHSLKAEPSTDNSL